MLGADPGKPDVCMPWQPSSARHRLPQNRRNLCVCKLFLRGVEQHGWIVAAGPQKNKIGTFSGFKIPAKSRLRLARMCNDTRFARTEHVAIPS